MSLLKILQRKDFKQVGRYISVRCTLLIGHNWVTTYISVRCTFQKPNALFYSCWWVTHKGQRP